MEIILFQCSGVYYFLAQTIILFMQRPYKCGKNHCSHAEFKKLQDSSFHVVFEYGHAGVGII